MTIQKLISQFRCSLPFDFRTRKVRESIYFYVNHDNSNEFANLLFLNCLDFRYNFGHYDEEDVFIIKFDPNHPYF